MKPIYNTIRKLSVINQAAIRRIFKAKGLRVSPTFLSAVNDNVLRDIVDAMNRLD